MQIRHEAYDPNGLQRHEKTTLHLTWLGIWLKTTSSNTTRGPSQPKADISSRHINFFRVTVLALIEAQVIPGKRKKHSRLSTLHMISVFWHSEQYTSLAGRGRCTHEGALNLINYKQETLLPYKAQVFMHSKENIHLLWDLAIPGETWVWSEPGSATRVPLRKQPQYHHSIKNPFPPSFEMYKVGWGTTQNDL